MSVPIRMISSAVNKSIVFGQVWSNLTMRHRDIGSICRNSPTVMQSEAGILGQLNPRFKIIGSGSWVPDLMWWVIAVLFGCIVSVVVQLVQWIWNIFASIWSLLIMVAQTGPKIRSALSGLRTVPSRSAVWATMLLSKDYSNGFEWFCIRTPQE